MYLKPCVSVHPLTVIVLVLLAKLYPLAGFLLGLASSTKAALSSPSQLHIIPTVQHGLKAAKLYVVF